MDAVQAAGAHGLVGADRLAEQEQALGQRRAEAALQQGDAVGVVDDAEARGGDDEAGVAASDAEVAAARELDAGAEDVAVEDGDGGGVGAAQGRGGREQGGVGRLGQGVGVLLREGVEVEAGAEAVLALAGQQDDLAAQLAGAALEPGEHRRREGVALARMIEGPAQQAGGELLLAHLSVGGGSIAHGAFAGAGAGVGVGVVAGGRACRVRPVSADLLVSGSWGCSSPRS